MYSRMNNWQNQIIRKSYTALNVPNILQTSAVQARVQFSLELKSINSEKSGGRCETNFLSHQWAGVSFIGTLKKSRVPAIPAN